ncbi:GNAT family N-acetyltransferase [Cytobacillus sp. FJAT-54145]|uniref:GNAT family N-acetyltransferase n=1 Tax=Cytobacillus spartinae TaxID=3299023 RepID=A0ABW6K9Y3_9BACI
MNLQTKFQMSKFNENDIPGLIRLSASVGWDYDLDEVSTVLAVGMIFGHKNEKDEIISSAAIIPYEGNLASIGMVIVNESYRGYKLGKELTVRCVNAVPSDKTIMLIATPEGKPLYEKLGFHSVSYVHKYINENYIPSIIKEEGYKIEPYSESDFSSIVHIDYLAIGAERRVFLEARIKQAEEVVVLKDSTGKVIGFGMSIIGSDNCILGPIVAKNEQMAKLIINYLAKEKNGKLRIDIPHGQTGISSFLESTGFIKVSQPPIMIKNSNQLPARNQTLYSIAAQIFG